jgi:hypothetical protein
MQHGAIVLSVPVVPADHCLTLGHEDFHLPSAKSKLFQKGVF